MPDYHETSGTSSSSQNDKNEKRFSGSAREGSSAADKNLNIDIPSISLPKGGGAIKSIDEKFEVNASSGSASLSIPLPTASIRGFSASLNVSYNSGRGNSSFGLGWGLNLPSIKRKTDKELPQYFDESDSDTYIFSGAEDLVPKMKFSGGKWELEETDSTDGQFRIRRYCPRIEGAFSRIERWTKKSDGIIHWQCVSKNNVTAVYGNTPSSVIADPADARKIFEWFIHFTYDDKGNCALYEYKLEDGGGMPAMLHNKNRMNGEAAIVNTYLKRVRTGNIDPYSPDNPIPAASQFLFETVLDYGEHDTINIPFNETGNWTFRQDAFSMYNAGFEIRNCRICRRVMLYHHFSELPGGSALVTATKFIYDTNDQPGNFNFLKEVSLTAYTKHDDGIYTEKSLPPVVCTYQKHAWDKTVKFPTPGSIPIPPAGINEVDYQWVDLYSEGLYGVLTGQNSALWYKRNLGDGNFSQPLPVSSRPSFAGTGSKLQVTELGADGSKYLAGYEGEIKGYFKINDDDEWEPFKTFEKFPNVRLDTTNSKFIDLNGDGQAELLIIEDNLFSWYPSLGEKGFESCRKVWQSFDEEKSPRMIFAEKEQSIFLADMNGDGLTDIVRIMNGSVCYWPNLGYGRFGARVSMDNAPQFDHPDLFNTSFIKLTDMDGSGTTDIVYFGKQQFTIWLNQHGNGFLSDPQVIDPFPEVSNMNQVAVFDFLGSGTACIVCSSVLPADREQPLRYIDPMNGKKPHLMSGFKNNMGKEVEWEYKPSTQFYLRDRLEGNPWITKLPFVMHCLAKVTTYDRIMKTRFASEYFYHHGYYDHAEREFRGFGRVDQKDAEDIVHFIKQSSGNMNNVVQQDLHQPPVLTKTWFHTGAFLDREKILSHFAHEYSSNSIHPENLLPEPDVSGDLSVEEWRQALRACKGMVLRKEVYALDDSVVSDKPFSVEQQNCFIKMLQPKQSYKYACFLVLNSESISYQYERNLADPRISHSFVLEVDEFGNTRKTVSLTYPRKTPLFPEQGECKTVYTENDFTNAIDSAKGYHTPVLYQTRAFEITGLATPVDDYYTLKEIKTACAAATLIDYNVMPTAALQKRIINWTRLQFRADDGVNVLSFGLLEAKALLHRSFKAAFNQSQLVNVFGSKISLTDLNTLLLNPVKGGYIFADAYYWIPSGTAVYDTAHFFHAISFTDPFGNVSKVEYDNKYHFFIQKTTDALNKETIVKKFNYRVLQPYQVQDANDNLSAVRFDETGTAAKAFLIGKKGIDAGDEFDDNKVEMSANDVPSSEFSYSMFEWFNQSMSMGFDINNYKPKPNFVKTKARETHFHADALHQTKIQESYAYFNGSGQILLGKVQATNLRWVGNGRTILNNKGKPVKKYEPYFSTNPAFDDEKEIVELGVTPIMHYDPLGRVIRTDAPNKTFSKIEFTSWLQKSFDQNDTVAESGWYDQRILNPVPAIATPEEIDAAQKSFQHNNTPSVSHLDTLGRTFLTEGDNVTEKISSRVIKDIGGKDLQIRDALNRVAMQYDYDLLGRSLKQFSLDAGARIAIVSVDNHSLLNWDDRGHTFSVEYDALRRVVKSFVQTGNSAPVLFNTIEYGESLPLSAAKANNLLGAAHKKCDQAGVLVTTKNDFKGNVLTGSRQLIADYKNIIDWTNAGAVQLEPEIFTNSTEYDALNRSVRMITPHTASMQPSEIIPSYNEASILNKIEVKIRGAAITSFVTNINYNAKGQRENIFYNNGTKTKYTYDEECYHLTNLLTTRNAGNVVLQDLHYTYDAAGNITRVKDNAQADIFFDNEMAQALNDYEYDAIYRLIKATGRKHAGQTDIQPKAALGNSSTFRDRPFINNNVINPNDANAFRNYTETYKYDKAGNIKEQKHVSKSSNWTRSFEYDNNNSLNNRMTKSSVNGDDYNYTYDSHGNMLGLETVQNETWDFMDHFRQAGLGGGGTIYFVYDAGGQRVRKVSERPNGMIKERIYLGGIEIYRERNVANTVTLERETLQVMDGNKRISMVDTPVIKPGGSNETQLIRYQYGNHLGSSSLELDDVANTISYEEYFPYGSTSYSTIDASREVPAKRYRYTGKERDEETGLNYQGARYYALWLLRWTAADPIGTGAGLNLYAYVNGNPVSLSDPNGTDPLDPPKYGYETRKFANLDECMIGTWTSCHAADDKPFSDGPYYGEVPRTTPPVTIASPPPPPKAQPKKQKPPPQPKKEEPKGREMSASELTEFVEDNLLPHYKYSPTYYRITGTFKLVFSGLEIVGGLYATPETLGGGLFIVGNGLDNGQAAAREIWTGESARTLKYHLSYSTATYFGADRRLANAFGQAGDFTGNLVSGGLSLRIAASPINIVPGAPPPPTGAVALAEGEPYEVIFYHGNVSGRDIVTVGTPAGPRAFYLRTGGGGSNVGGAQAGQWAPFDGWASETGIFSYEGSYFKSTPGWFVKHRYGAGLSETDPLYRFGTPENVNISGWLGNQNIVLSGPKLPWYEVQPELQFFGVPTIDPIPTYGAVNLSF